MTPNDASIEYTTINVMGMPLTMGDVMPDREKSTHSNVLKNPKEYDILCFLIENKNIAIGREQLLSSIWGYDFYGEDRTIDTHIKMLRSNLGKYRDCIKTVRGFGYKYEEDEE